MFKKPTSTAPGKENIGAAKPRLGLSSLHFHQSSKVKVENDIESAGASMKVLSVENTKQKVSPVDAQLNKAKIGVVSSTKPIQSATRTTPVTQQMANSANEGTNINDIKPVSKVGSMINAEKKDGIKMNDGHSARAPTKHESNHSAPSVAKHEANAPKPNNNPAGHNPAANVPKSHGNELANRNEQKKSWELSNFDIGRPLGK